LSYNPAETQNVKFTCADLRKNEKKFKQHKIN